MDSEQREQWEVSVTKREEEEEKERRKKHKWKEEEWEKVEMQNLLSRVDVLSYCLMTPSNIMHTHTHNSCTLLLLFSSSYLH